MEEKETQTEVKKEQGGDHLTIKKDTLWKGLTFVFAVLFVVSLFTGGFGGTDSAVTGNVVANDAQPTQPNNPTPSPVKVEIDDDAVFGDKNAEVTLIEFSDYECPFCGKYYSETYSQIKKAYVDTGKVKIVFRDFPLSFHQNAQKSAEAAECAGEQNKYFEMHDKLFENQQALDVVSLKKYAQEIGLNVGDFNACLDSGKMVAEIKKDFADGQAAGVKGTPAFFINGKLLSGAQPFSAFQQAIDAEL